MSIVVFTHKGDFHKMEKFLRAMKKNDMFSRIDAECRKGVQALAAATPVDTGKTASLWNYEIEKGRNGVSIRWTNDNINKGINIAIILQYGHGTGTGGYVQGRDYINPVMRPIFDQIAESVWKVVTSA